MRSVLIYAHVEMIEVCHEFGIKKVFERGKVAENWRDWIADFVL